MFYLAGNIRLILVVCLFACTSIVHAATIMVMQDGTGDFELIQPALDAAASGDTILIGPGEYLASNPSYIPGYAWDVEVFGFVRVDELTIIGAGSLETIIGPDEYYGSTATYSPKCIVWLEGTALGISGVTLRNCYEGIHATNAPIFIDDCRIIDNRIGIIWATQGSGGSISNCIFDSSIPGGPNGVTLLGNGGNVTIEDCLFEGAKVSINSLDNISIRGCEIQNMVVGLQVDNGTHCFVENCRISNCVNVGGVLLGPSTVCEMVDCEISGGGAAFYIGSHCYLNATQSIFHGGYWSVIEMNGASEAQISDCNLFPGSGPAVRSFRPPSYGEVVHDLRNNFWGTTDAEEIRSLILDGVDDPDNASVVLFDPFVGGSVPTEKMSFDSLKAMFR